MFPSSGLLTNGQMAAHSTVERIEARFGLAKHHASEAKRAFIATSLWNSWTAFSTGTTFRMQPGCLVYRRTGLICYSCAGIRAFSVIAVCRSWSWPGPSDVTRS